MYPQHIEAAIEVAKRSDGVGGKGRNRFRLGAILADGPIALSWAVNSYKTHPRLVRFYEYPHIHAEAGCILKAGFDACRHRQLYVARIRRSGSPASAKPCKECQAFIKLAGISQVYYTGDLGGFQSLF